MRERWERRGGVAGGPAVDASGGRRARRATTAASPSSTAHHRSHHCATAARCGEHPLRRRAPLGRRSVTPTATTAFTAAAVNTPQQRSLVNRNDKINQKALQFYEYLLGERAADGVNAPPLLGRGQ